MPDSSKAAGFNPAFATVTTLFFMWGFVTATIDPLVPSVRSVFDLTYAESMLTQFAFFMAYGVVSLPAAFVLERLGYAWTIVVSLGAMVLGCLLVPLATAMSSYPLVLAALFVIAAGITQLQVAANPLAALLGRPEGSHFRLTLSQTFNSLGTVLAPILGSYVMLRGGVFAGESGAAARGATLRNVDTQFLLIAAIVVLLTLFIASQRRLLHVAGEEEERNASPFAAFSSRWALFGGLAIFLYVGAEVAISSIMINFLHQPEVMAKSFDEAGRLLGIFYWGGAMAGRALGSLVLTRVRADRVLAFAATAALLLCLAVTQAAALGAAAGVAALAVGFFNSIMFPTIFTLTLERSHAPASSTSGLLCMAIVGGAILPPIAGFAADRAGIAPAFFVPAASYACIALFALTRPSAHRAAQAAPPATV
ncbi:MAG TPA: glucose/galactose MFS transporter [Rhizomicrobium sp.]|nr:glucose/galactose MFS transporter [Rhizomicrobium sp.]